MTTQQTTPGTRETNLAIEKFEAEIREAEGRLKVLEARAEARKAKADMDEISGLSAAKEQVRKEIADMKQRAASDYSNTKQTVEKHIKELQVNIQRVHDRYSAWDDARERRFYARMDEAEARLKVWKAKADQARADDIAETRDDLAKLDKTLAEARARAKDAKEKHTAKAQKTLEEAERRFDEAFDAVAKRFGKP